MNKNTLVKDSLINMLKNEANEISKIDSFETYVNTRKFEEEITRIAKTIDFSVIKSEDLKKEVDNISDKNVKFIFFFIVFTALRRAKFGSLESYVDKYCLEFTYPIFNHIELLSKKPKSDRELRKLMIDAWKLTQIKYENVDFTSHEGILNNFSELTARYYENNLDKRNDQEDVEMLNSAKDCIERAISLSKKSTGENNIYPKYYLNKGRLLALLGKYDDGEFYINLAIESIKEDSDRVRTVNEYQQYLLKVSIIRSFDLSDEKVRDLEKIKVNNYKIIALMTTLLGFLLGEITIFSKIEDVFTMTMLMLAYLALLLILCGVVLFSLSITFKERKKKLYVFDIGILIVGIILFTITMIIILNKR